MNDMKFEIVVIPVSDVDRAKEFYGRLGWRLDADFAGGDDFRAIQFTPPGSRCSVIFGKNVTAAAPGSASLLGRWCQGSKLLLVLSLGPVGVWVTLLYAVGRGGAGALQALVGRFGRAMLMVALGWVSCKSMESSTPLSGQPDYRCSWPICD